MLQKVMFVTATRSTLVFTQLPIQRVTENTNTTRLNCLSDCKY